jgi:hypothetical protein
MNAQPNEKKLAIRNVLSGLLMSATLGLAPFFPEPHIVGKIRWIAGGAVGMQPMDWFDTVLHGAPFLFLMYTLFKLGLVLGKKAA